MAQGAATAASARPALFVCEAAPACRLVFLAVRLSAEITRGNGRVAPACGSSLGCMPGTCAGNVWVIAAAHLGTTEGGKRRRAGMEDLQDGVRQAVVGHDPSA